MFIDEWFKDNFYKQLPLGYHQNFSFGQFFKTHAYYPHENLQLWRPVPTPGEPAKTIASNFQMVPAGKDAFKRGYPLEAPKLGTKEEFLVIRAKIRPVVLIVPEAPSFGVENRGYRGKVQRRLCCVAQVYGLADVETGRREFGESFVQRVRRMEFPQLIFLPARVGLLDVRADPIELKHYGSAAKRQAAAEHRNQLRTLVSNRLVRMVSYSQGNPVS